jgi:hypothetical protein
VRAAIHARAVRLARFSLPESREDSVRESKVQHVELVRGKANDRALPRTPSAIDAGVGSMA